MGYTENLMSLLPGLRNQRKAEGGGVLHEHKPSFFLCQTLCTANLLVLWPLAYCWPFCIFNSALERLWV